LIAVDLRADPDRQRGEPRSLKPNPTDPTQPRPKPKFSAPVLSEPLPCRLWELILADNAEAEFIELTTSQLMQSIHHVVMTTCKRLINSGRLQYR
jgi:hypothetical protein